MSEKPDPLPTVRVGQVWLCAQQGLRCKVEIIDGNLFTCHYHYANHPDERIGRFHWINRPVLHRGRYLYQIDGYLLSDGGNLVQLLYDPPVIQEEPHATPAR